MTFSSVDRRSIQLSYGRVPGRKGSGRIAIDQGRHGGPSDPANEAKRSPLATQRESDDALQILRPLPRQGVARKPACLSDLDRARRELASAEFRAKAPQLVVFATDPLEKLAYEYKVVGLGAELLADLALDGTAGLLPPTHPPARKVPLPAAAVGVAHQQNLVAPREDADRATLRRARHVPVQGEESVAGAVGRAQECGSRSDQAAVAR